MAKRRNAGLRVLLVDDSPRNCPLVARELQAEFAAARVEQVGDVDSFEQAWTRGPVGAVILDAGLLWAAPAVVAKRVKEQDPECPVILFVEPGSEQTASLAVGTNIDDYVVKYQDAFVHLSSTIRQILEKGRTADALRKGETRYDDLFAGMPVGLYLTTPAGQILDANPALVQLLGYPDRESLLAANVGDIHVQPTDRAKVLRELERDGIAHEQGLRLKRADGETLIVDEHTRAIRDENGRVVAIEGALVDMTERTQMETQLRQLTSELQAISLALPDLYFSLAADGTILNYRAGREADLYVRPGEFLGKKMQDVLPRESGRMFADGISRVLRQEQGVTLEYVLPIDGAEKTFEARLAPLDGDKIIAAIRDVTERVRVQLALLESEKRFRTLVERAVDALVLHDMQGKIIDVNRQACESLGYTREEMLGLHVSDIEAEHPASTLPGLWESIAQRGAVTLHSSHRRKDGSTFPVEMRVGSFEAEGRRLILAQIRDVSERERTEGELLESRRQLATLMSNLPGMAYRCRNDTTWTMEFVSQGCLALTGYAPNDLVQNHRLSYAELIDSDDRQTVWDAVQASVGEDRPFQLEYRIHTAGGEVRWVWEQGQGVGRTEDGELILEGFIADVTARRQSEIRLQESQAYLRSIVEAVDDILIVYDADGRYVDVVTRDPSLLRLPREEMIGYTVREVLPEQVADLFLQAIRRLIDTHEPQVIEYPLTVSGDELWFRARGQLVESPSEDRARTLWAISEITHSKLAEEALRRREAVLEAVAYAAERFLRTAEWAESIEAVLARLGQAAAASRAYLFQCHTGEDGRRLVSQRYEWTAPGTASQIGAQSTRDVPRDTGGFARWSQILEAGGVVAGDADEFETAEQEMLKGQDICSLLLVPVFIGSNLWGFLGYDACGQEREWTEGEIDALRAAAGALGAAILRQQEEAAFRRLEEFHEDIVQNMAEGILVTDAEGRFVFGNPAAARMLGYAPGELVGMHTRQVIAEEQWPLVEAADERRRLGLADHYEVDTTRKDGTRMPSMVSGCPRMRDGNFDGTLAVFTDMSEQKQARQALQLAESRFRALVEQSPAAVYMDRVDETGGAVYMSPQIEAMLGFSPEEWAADSNIWLRLIHPEDLPRFLAQNEITNQTGVPFDEEYRLRARDGRVVWVRDQAVVLGDEDKGRYRQGVLSDVTQRKQAEETLRALLNASPDVGFLMDSGGTILALNEQLARLARRTPEDLIGANIDAILPPDVAQSRRRRFREVVRTGQASRFSDRSQSLWYDNSVYPIFDDEGYVSRMAVFARDITEQVEAVQALRESEEQFRGLADNSPNMIFINQGGRLVYANAACTEQMGYTQAELLASDFEFMSLIAQEDRDLIRQRFVAHAKGEEVAPYECTICAKDGQRRFAINATKLIKYGGTPAILGIVTDITERKRAEEALRQLSDTFQAIIQASPLAVTMVDPERKVQLWNPAAERIFGWPAEEVIGGDVPFVPADERAEFHGLTDRVYAGETITGVELTRVRREGSPVEIELSAAPLRGPQGQVRGIMAVIADITERKRAVRDQSESAEKVRTVFEAVTDGISLINLDRVFIDGNDAVVRLHGFRDKAELLGKRPLDLIADVDRARAEADVTADMRVGRGSVHEYRMLRTDGSEFVGELSTAWLKDEHGAPAGLVGITRDITERKRAEEALARHARELSVLYQTSIDIGSAGNATAMMEAVVRQATELLGGEMGGLYLMDPDRSGLCLVLGYRLPPGIVGTRLSLGEGVSGRVAQTGEALIVEDYRHWEGRAQAYDRVPFHHVLGVPLKRGDQVVGVINISDYREDGGFTPEDVRLASLFADQVAGALENARLLEETTRRAAFQEAIVRVAAALRVAPGRAELMPIILDQLGELLKVQGAGLITVAPEEGGWVILLGKGAWEGLTGRGLPPEAQIVRDTIESGQPFVMAATPEPMVASWPEVFASGQSIAVVPLMVEQKAIGALAVARDSAVSADEIRLLTAIAEMAGVALHRAGVMETLEEHVQERTRALAEANDRLKELDRLKSQFVSNVSHELRTPITNVLLYLDLVSQPGKEEKRGMYLSVLKREAERLGSLIEDLLTLSRMDQGAMGLNLELRTLDPVVGEVMAVQRARAEAKGISLNLEPNPEVPPVWIAHQPIIQVFTNLLSNAIAYTHSAGHVSVSSDVVLGDSGPMVAARVHNDGPPIPEEDMPQLFQRFFRGKTGRQSGEPGTGLGLAICREIVERHHGRIEVVSSAEQGTTFTVLLPLPSE